MTKLFKSIGKTLLGGVGSAIGGALGISGKKKKGPVLLAPPTRDDALEQITAEDELRKRRGASADLISGTTGFGEALGGGKFNVTGN